MTTQEIANKLVQYCREGKYDECYAELYSPDVVSIEPKGAQVEIAHGLDGIAAKGKAWSEMVVEMHGNSVGDPIVSGNHFSCTMTMEATFKEPIGREKMEEICLYQVKDGKIVKEQFFYDM